MSTTDNAFRARAAVATLSLLATVVSTIAAGADRSGASVATCPAVKVAAQAKPAGWFKVGSCGTVESYQRMNWLGNGDPGTVSFAPTPSGNGYWTFTSSGCVRTFGDAKDYGSMCGRHLNGPILDAVATTTGKGYWMVASDGGIFSFGDAHFYGSMGNTHLWKPVVSMAPTADGKGYWLVASDGGIFTFGDAHFVGSLGGQRIAAPIVSVASTLTGKGYMMIGRDDEQYVFGDAQQYVQTGPPGCFDSYAAWDQYMGSYAPNSNQLVVTVTASANSGVYSVRSPDGSLPRRVSAIAVTSLGRTPYLGGTMTIPGKPLSFLAIYAHCP